MVAGAGPASADRDDEQAERVLVLSLPTVTWAQLQRVSTPNLDRILTRAAVGNLVTSGVMRPAPLADAHPSLGAGARFHCGGGSANSSARVRVDEPFDVTAGTVFESRTGIPPGQGLVYMDIADATETNDAELYGAQIGLLGSELAAAGISRAVVANGDGSDPSVPDTRVSPYRRAAVSALMTRDGKVPGGQVDDALLTHDRRAPFGVRLDANAVEAAFATGWTARSAVLIEGSDLVRADIASRFASPSAGERLRIASPHRCTVADSSTTSTSRDVVVVAGTALPTDDGSLTVTGRGSRLPAVVAGTPRSATS
jgi:hypothetical protein